MSDNTVGWQEYVTRLLEEQEHKTALRFAASQRAVEHAMSALDYRLERMNEFRSQIQKEREDFVRRDQLSGFKEKIAALEKSMANIEGRFWVLGIGGLLIGLAALLVRFIT